MRRAHTVLWLVLSVPPVLPATELSADAEHRVRRLATCAAYYLNASRVRPMAEYETWYAAGEKAANRARRIAGDALTDRFIGDAAVAMTALTGNDWNNFERVRLAYGADCDALLGAAD